MLKSRRSRWNCWSRWSRQSHQSRRSRQISQSLVIRVVIDTKGVLYFQIGYFGRALSCGAVFVSKKVDLV